MNYLTTEKARRTVAARKHHRGGRPKKRTRCRKCGQFRASARAAWIHCQKPHLDA